MVKYVYHDGGRAAAGFKGKRASDCVARAIAIATGLPYREVYDRLAEGNQTQRVTKRVSKRRAGRRTASEGINTDRKWFNDYMSELGFEWYTFTEIGRPSRIRLTDDESLALIPKGKVILSMRGHVAALIDGVLYDAFNSSTQMSDVVYGYWLLKRKKN